MRKSDHIKPNCKQKTSKR